MRYYSTERGEFEEIPLEMVDLARTKKELAEREAEKAVETKEQAEEDNAERAAYKEIQEHSRQRQVRTTLTVTSSTR